MKRIISVLILIVSVFLIIIAFPIHTFSYDENNSLEQDEIMEGIDKNLKTGIPDEADDFLSDNDISLENPESISTISVNDFFTKFLDTLKDTVTTPIKLLGSLLLIIIIISVGESIVQNGNGTGRCIEILSVLICIGVLYPSVESCVETVKTTVSDISTFIMAYVPIFSSIVASCGNSSTGVSYYVVILGLCEVITMIINYALVPILNFSIATNIVESINPSVSFGGLTEGITKIAKWGLSLITTIFIAVMSIQSVIGTSVDTVGIKTAKYAASSLIPVVGSAVSDAYSSIMGSLSLIKSGVGVIGIIIIIVVALKPILYVCCLKIVLSLTDIASSFFGLCNISKLLKGINQILSIVLGMLVCFTIVFIISTAVVMLLSFSMV